MIALEMWKFYEKIAVEAHISYLLHVTFIKEIFSSNFIESISLNIKSLYNFTYK